MSFNEYLEKKEIENSLNRLFKGEMEPKEESKYDVIEKNKIEDEEVNDKVEDVIEEPVVEPIEEIKATEEQKETITDLFMDDYQTVNESPEMIKGSNVVFMGGGVGRGEVDEAILNQSQNAIFTPAYHFSATTIKDALYQIDNRVTHIALSAGLVTSVFGRVEDIVAQSGDYDASQIIYENTNVSAFLVTLTDYTNGLSADIDANYYTKSEVNSISSTLYQQLSADNDSWVGVSGNYYTSIQTNNIISSVSSTLFNKTSFVSATIGNVSAGDYLTIEPTGFQQFNGSAVAWEDLRAPASQLSFAGASVPTRSTEDGSLIFAGNQTQNIAVWFQIPHSYKLGTPLYPHIHWYKGVSGTGNPNWRVRYKYASLGQVFPVFGAYLSAISFGPNTTSANVHTRTSFPPISGADIDISTMVCIWLERTTTDSFGNNNVNLIEVDLHYQRDTNGSRQEYIK